eukprot:TRINITY_DN31784_c0_g1_i1.p1 TRINITY_DN31784_c0_g1~~TRINITY_DN31784_c0_g1_i1.p1  ORF type:complete len:499 (+),score=127.21 TRINITY_DN31784_c0_g1_i1:41-1498(+)
MMHEEPEEPEEDEGTTSKPAQKPQRRRPLRQRKHAKMVGNMVAAVVTIVAVSRREQAMATQRLYGSEEDAHTKILENTVSRLSKKVESLHTENSTLRRTAHATAELATIQEIKEAFIQEMDEITTEKLRWASDRAAMREEKRALEEVLQVTQNIAKQDLHNSGITDPAAFLAAYLQGQNSEVKDLQNLQERLLKAETAAAEARSEAGKLLVLLSKQGIDPRTMEPIPACHIAPITYQQYRTHLECLQKKLNSSKKKIAALEWEARHHPDLDHTDTPPVVLSDEPDDAPATGHHKKIDDLLYLNASILEQLRGKEKELQDFREASSSTQADQCKTISTLEAKLAQAARAAKEQERTTLDAKKTAKLVEEENIRLNRRMSKLEAEAKRLSEAEPVESVDAEELNMLKCENEKLKKAWEEFGVHPSHDAHDAAAQDGAPPSSWSSWTSTKAKNLGDIFLNPSYIRTATRFGTPTVPASSVPSMHGPDP